MTQPDPILPVLADEELSERAAAVFDDIRATRNTDFVNNIWRVLANDPNLLEQTWSEVKNTLTEDSELDVLTKQLIYIGRLRGAELQLLHPLPHRRRRALGLPTPSSPNSTP